VVVQRAQQTLGKVDAALLDYKFTAPGKEEFSDTLRKVLKEKYPNTPIIGLGPKSKGGEQGKHYHGWVVSSGRAALLSCCCSLLSWLLQCPLACRCMLSLPQPHAMHEARALMCTLACCEVHAAVPRV
jgi:hypothetical protein